MLVKLGSPSTFNITSCGSSTTSSMLNKISSFGSAFKTEHDKTVRRSSFFKPLATVIGKRYIKFTQLQISSFIKEQNEDGRIEISSRPIISFTCKSRCSVFWNISLIWPA
ncbi:hypothetical protein HanIR_Chr14g0671101 [Helianthus annuus]|nr:hypothetical protein HanIR_Chr14g0671101 [Helianthus annuus]